MVCTRAVLIAVGLVSALQFLFTYAPLMHQLFQSRPVTISQGLVVIAVGVLGLR